MQTLKEIKEFLEANGLSPKKSLGQNFLIDQNLVRKIVDEAGVREGDTVLEVGPGTGALTEELLARGARVVACELDDGLAPLLALRAREWPGGERLTVIHGDCLSKDRSLSPAIVEALGPAVHSGFLLVANLPYGAATPLMTSLLMHFPACRTLAVTIQNEVADRLLAEPRTKDYGGLSVIAQAIAEGRRIATLPRECFWPRPDVTSAMVVLARRAQPLTADVESLSGMCRRLFASRRKQLGSILGRGIAWPENIRPEQRPEELTVHDIERLRLVVPPP